MSNFDKFQPVAVLLRRSAATKAKHKPEVGEYLVRLSADIIPGGTTPVATVTKDGQLTLIDPSAIVTPQHIALTVAWLGGNIDGGDTSVLGPLASLPLDQLTPDQHEQLQRLVMRTSPYTLKVLLKELQDKPDSGPALLGAVLLNGTTIHHDTVVAEWPLWLRFWGIQADVKNFLDHLRM